jgi:hypothetical protein
MVENFISIDALCVKFNEDAFLSFHIVRLERYNAMEKELMNIGRWGTMGRHL